jgi:uncharacterized membrane protein YqjE
MKVGEPRVMSEPGEVTDVVDAFDGDDVLNVAYPQEPLYKAVKDGRLAGEVQDEADLLAAEANVAVRTLVTCVFVAVGAAVFAALGLTALLGMIAMRIVESGYSWPAALGSVFLMCAVISAVLAFALRGLARQKLFAASRRELRGRA